MVRKVRHVPVRLVVVLVVIALAAIGTRVAIPSEVHAKFAPAQACGVERWNVKTLADHPNLLATRRTTIARLDALPAPRTLPSTRLPFERHVFTVTGAVTLVRPEADSDLHVVLISRGHTMIAESAAPYCAARATPRNRVQIGRVRALVHVCASATVTGVAFFDYLHGQTGAAPNGIELHPILSFRCGKPSVG